MGLWLSARSVCGFQVSDGNEEAMDALTDPEDRVPRCTSCFSLLTYRVTRGIVGREINQSDVIHYLTSTFIFTHRELAIELGDGFVHQVATGVR